MGAEVGRYLAERGDLVAVVVHPEERRGHGESLTSLGVPVIEWPASPDSVASYQPECLFSVLFGYILDASWLRVPSWAAVNLHPALLPWNRGSAPNAWPLVDGSPAGTTLHLMVESVDAGAIIAQRSVDVRPDDTAATLYRRLEDASLALVEHTWPDIRRIEPQPQPSGGSYHRLADLASLDLTPEDLAVLDKLRARTFPPYGAEFERDGRRWVARIEIEPV